MTAVMYLTAAFTAPTVPFHTVVFLAASVSVIAAGRVSDRLWEGTAAPAFPQGSPRFRLLSRLPYRFLAGGIAFTTILLVSKKMALVPVRDVPVSDLFWTGGTVSVCYYGFIEGFRVFRERASERPAGGRTGNQQGYTHDKNRTA